MSTTLVVEAAEAGRSYHRRGMGVAEVVAPVGAGAAPWARRLVVALIQKGVTATCSEADRNRYGGLLGDCNLPDFRVAVGGPRENPFVAAILQAAGPAYSKALEDQLARQGWARLLVPARAALERCVAAREPTFETRGLCPCFSWPAVTRRRRWRLSTHCRPRWSPDAWWWSNRPPWFRSRSRCRSGPRPCLTEVRPGFAVDCGGALHVSLLRACTGWPSGVWIDPPRRFAPDGSAFELEHWSHVFENALLLGRGDWREAGCVEEALAFNRPLRASHCRPPPRHAAAARSIVRRSGRPRRMRGTIARPRWCLAALKPAGNPLAAGDPLPEGDESGQETEVSLRYYEVDGHPAEVEIESLFPISGARRANLLEEPGEPLALTEAAKARPSTVALSVEAAELATIRLRLGRAGGTVAPINAEDSWDTEVAQPVFSRYWLHNKGPAPMGNQAVAVHVLPTALVLRAGEVGEFIAQVASGSTHVTQSGQVELLGPEHWDLEPSGQLFSLSPGAFMRVPARLRVPENCRPGRYFVAVRVFDSAGQAQEDVVTVDVVPALAEAGHAEGHFPGDPKALLAKSAPFNHPAGQALAELEVALENSGVGACTLGGGHAWSRAHQPHLGRTTGRGAACIPDRDLALPRPPDTGF